MCLIGVLSPLAVEAGGRTAADLLADGAATRASTFLSEDGASERGRRLLQFALGLQPDHPGALLLMGKLETGQPIAAAKNAMADSQYLELLRMAAAYVRKPRRRASEVLCHVMALDVEPSNEAALRAMAAAKNAGVDVSFDALRLEALGKKTRDVFDVPVLAVAHGKGKDDLCEVEVAASTRVSVAELRPGVRRLSGRYGAAITGVNTGLFGAQFVRVPWQANVTLEVKVLKSGFLYPVRVRKTHFGRSADKWESVGPALTGPWAHSGCRRKLRKGTKLELSGYEVSLIASKITLK